MFLGDISNVNNDVDLIYILTSVLTINMFIIVGARYTTALGGTINQWYSKLSMTAVMLDVLLVIIRFVTTRYTFEIFDIPHSPELFIIVLITIQVVHDAILYNFVIFPYPTGNNKVVDLYKDYANENNFKIVASNSAIMLSSALLAMYLKNKDMHETTTLLISVLYSIPYFIYQNAK